MSGLRAFFHRPAAGPCSRLIGALSAGVVLLGPVVLAFSKGGYYPQARWSAGLVVWLLVGVAALAAPAPWPRSRPGWLALIGLALLTGWTALSQTWAPLSIPAAAELQRALVYLGAFVAAAAWLRGRALRWVEPAVGAGALVVVTYGLSERWLPGLVELARSETAAGRLDQPYTYWNAMGALAAIGWVLAIRVSADSSRPPGIAAAGAAASVPLALGMWLTFSRGALVGALAGSLVLVVLAPRRRQLWSISVATLAAAPVVGAVQALPGVAHLSGSSSGRSAEGAGLLAVTLVMAAIAGAASWRLQSCRAGDRELSSVLRRAALALGALVVVGLVVAVVAAEKRGPTSPAVYGATAARFGSADSLRYEYWRVALNEWRQHPVRGGGPGAFEVAWLRDRQVQDTVRQAHSLYVQTLADLGLIGLGLLSVFLVGLIAAARQAYARAPAATAGVIAGMITFFVHAGLDWDWQMPALVLVGLTLAGAVIALAKEEPPSPDGGTERR